MSRKRPAYEPRTVERAQNTVPYAELHAHSSYSFLDGASSPTEMAEQAARLGLTALAITDHDGMYGIVRAAEAADALGLGTVFGAELSVDTAFPRTVSDRAKGVRSAVPDPPGRHLLVLARGPAGYASLCRAISLAQLGGGAKGHPVYDWDELAELADGQWLVLTGCRKGPVRAALEAAGLGTFALERARAALTELVARFGSENVAVELSFARDPLADERYELLARLAGEQGLLTVATTGAHYHDRRRFALANTMAAIRARSTVDQLDGWLPAWAEHGLLSGEEVAARLDRFPQAVPNAARLGRELAFPLALIAPDLPPFPVPAPHRDEMDYLRHLTYQGARERYGPRSSATEQAYTQLEHELGIIGELNFPGYFLIVWELSQFCREHGILSQGRGSAANSAVCYCLGVTAVDPIRYQLLFERFLSTDRGEPPDIDIDIESDRREEVIQHVYAMHGRHHAAQVANVITYRARSAIRDVASALGYSPGQQDAWSKQVEHRYWTPATDPSAIARQQDAEADIPDMVLRLAGELQDMPRHLGIHSGGMVLCDRPVIEVCPVEWGRMKNRSVLQWDKDD
ncbi:MAG: PHP domain-containing protein, partial [Jatrophihabitantaceae bacterium]